jgi:uracil-DNA glycosylase
MIDMTHDFFTQFADFIKTADMSQLEAEIAKPDALRLATGAVGAKRIDVAYAPFDHINRDARIVIVGLTPGRQQMRDAILEARRLLHAGASLDAARAGAKVHASFSGPLRRNLVDMLDNIGVARLLGINSTADLWEHASEAVHFTSVLRYPVFVDGANYSGAPHLLGTPILMDQVRRWFAEEALMLRHAIFVPLGPKVAEAVEAVAGQAGIDPGRILTGLPHPSGANNERIAFFLGRKPRADLSGKVAPDKLLSARHALEARIRKIGDLK